MWLLWVLSKNRPQPGSMFVSRENQIWPNFPGNHLLTLLFFISPPQLFFLFPFSLLPRVLLDLFKLSVWTFLFSRHWWLPNRRLQVKEERAQWNELSHSCKSEALQQLKKYGFILFFFKGAWCPSWIGIYEMFSFFAFLILWGSYCTDLLSQWYSNLADVQVRWLYLERHTRAHNICQNMWPSRILFSFLYRYISTLSTPSPPAIPPSPLLPWILQESEAFETKTKLLVTDRNIFISEIPHPDVWECRYKYN